MASDARTITGRAIVAGDAVGKVLVLEQGLSFAMGFDVIDGRITDGHSPAHGQILTGRVLVMPVGRGSSSASTSLAEAIRLGTAPAAIILEEVDEILVVGAIVARTLYARVCPIVIAEHRDLAAITSGAIVRVGTDGMILALASSVTSA